MEKNLELYNYYYTYELDSRYCEYYEIHIRSLKTDVNKLEYYDPKYKTWNYYYNGKETLNEMIINPEN